MVLGAAKRLLAGRKGKFVLTWVLAKVLLAGAVFLMSKHALQGQNHVEKRAIKEGEAAVPLAGKKYMEFNDFLNGRFSARSFYPNWVTGNQYVYRLDDGSFALKNIDDESEIQLLPDGTWGQVTNAFSYTLSADTMYMAIFYNQTDGYAHYVRTYSVAFFNTVSGNRVTFTDFPSTGVQKFKWGPVAHEHAYVQGFNIFMAKDEVTAPNQLTTDGDEQMMFNGISDWLFLGEITDDDALFWWSPDAKYLAYATNCSNLAIHPTNTRARFERALALFVIDETGVTTFEYTIYGNTRYPTMQKMPYPKAGTNIPSTSVTIVEVETLKPVVIQLDPDLVTSWGEYYLNNALWLSNNIFSPTWKNRYENEAVSETCYAPDFNCNHTQAMYTASSTGWVGHYKVSHLYPSSIDGEYFTVNSNGGFAHIARIDQTADWRTSGSFEVTDTGYGYTSVHFYDEANDMVYFTSTEMESNPGTGLPRIRHLWKVKARGTEIARTCITCQLNVLFPDRCNWVNPSFSTDGSFLVINCGGTGNGVPVSTVHKMNADGDYEFVRVAENNTQLQQTLQEYYFRERVYGSIKLPGISGDWYYSLHKPPNFDETKKYPMLVQVYSGPASQEVQDYYSVSWKDYVASSLDVVVMSFDGRGSGFRGENDRHQVYKHLGDLEIADQITAAESVSQIYTFVDPSRRAIWGWSYGGYATTKTIAADSGNVFKCGYAVAPVTDWQFYHAIYTERYMLKPTDNAANYEKSSALHNMDNFKSHRYTLIHGTKDENVHFQNSARLSMQLIASDVDFGAFYAADDDHSMRQVPNGYKNVYKIITRQMLNCFNLA